MRTCFAFTLALVALALNLTSCSAPGRYFDDTYNSPESNLTLGTVQKEIVPGMAQDAVACALGSPNIVTKDKEGKETWIYDKIASEVRRSSSSGLILFFTRGADEVSRTEKTQRTLTVVIKFNEQQLVEEVNYHSSKF
jgi:outer membrane protein assembly factor BamE (lipoprotein component of BamABCDE complex)